MPVAFDICPAQGLAVVRMTGFVTIDETMQATKDYVAHPDYRPGQKQLVDLSGVTDYEKDYARFILMQATKTGRFTANDMQTLVVYYAPTPIAQELGMLYLRSWDGVDAVVPILQPDEAQSLTLLGTSHNSIAALLAESDGRALH